MPRFLHLVAIAALVIGLSTAWVIIAGLIAARVMCGPVPTFLEPWFAVLTTVMCGGLGLFAFLLLGARIAEALRS